MATLQPIPRRLPLPFGRHCLRPFSSTRCQRRDDRDNELKALLDTMGAPASQAPNTTSGSRPSPTSSPNAARTSGPMFRSFKMENRPKTDNPKRAATQPQPAGGLNRVAGQIVSDATPANNRATQVAWEQHQRAEERRMLEQQNRRPWQAGDVYAPHDLNTAEADKWRVRRRKPKQDVFDLLGINPLNEYKNFSVMAEFTTETGRIKHPKLTGLRPVNQRKIAKAIRRAIGIGLIPSVHKHPMLMLQDAERRNERRNVKFNGML